MRVLICASPTFDDAKTVRAALEHVAAGAAAGGFPVLTIVTCASATGPDEIADQWIRYHRGEPDVVAERHPALWQKYKTRAGIVRNEQVVARGATLALAFLRGDETAAHLVELVSDAGIPLRVWHYGEPGVTSMDSRHLADEDVLREESS